MESIFKINERVYRTQETEYHNFTYLGEDYVLVQSEHPQKAEGYTYVFRKDIDCSISADEWQEDYEYTPVLHINWQTSGVNTYLLDDEETTESALILSYLLATDPVETKAYIDSCMLRTEISDRDSAWRYFQLCL